MEKLFYKTPAHIWSQALPIGNGKSGVMIYGGKRKEKLAFNDTTLWSGYPKEYNNTESLKNIEKVRQLIFEGKNDEADSLAETKLSGFYSQSFMPLGNLFIKFGKGSHGNYTRELDLEKAIHTVNCGNVKRETFASFPHKIIVYRITSPDLLSLTLSADSKLHYEVNTVNNGLNLLGNAPDFVAPNYLRTEINPIRYNEGKGMSFCLRAEVNTDGKISFLQDKIKIKDAKEIVIFVTTETGFLSYDKMPRTDRAYPLAICEKELMNVEHSYEKLKSKHIADYQKLFNKSRFSICDGAKYETESLIKSVKKGKLSPNIVQLFYNYGKYMTIAASREGGQAMNLQGIWNNSTRPAWSCNYTTNINAEMNYWGASNANLSECLSPYIDLVYECLQNGKKTAKINHGTNGFACNHNVDIWRKTPPVQGDANYMYAPLCSVWLANELYEHYENGGLEKYKDKIFEIVVEAAIFASDYLVEHNGYLVTCPSASPEAVFLRNGTKCKLDYASNFEMGLIKQCFENTLKIDNTSDFAKKVIEQTAKLYPFEEGKVGLKEWGSDPEIAEKGHRHFSPLYAFYPARQIKYYENSKETSWVKKLFDYRLENSKSHVGWSAAWAICLSARLHDANRAIDVIKNMLAHAIFKNLFDAHPPLIFQIDGNLGFVAGINEMLCYYENGKIELLPALPKEWSEGKMSGYKVKGATLDFDWKGGKIISIKSDILITIMDKNLAKDCRLDNVTIDKK